MDKHPQNVQPEMTFRSLPDGAREITHPSGLKVIETREQRQTQRAEMVRMRNDLTMQIADLDAASTYSGQAEEVKIMAAIAVVAALSTSSGQEENLNG
jgi:hypothetical protein